MPPKTDNAKWTDALTLHLISAIKEIMQGTTAENGLKKAEWNRV